MYNTIFCYSNVAVGYSTSNYFTNVTICRIKGTELYILKIIKYYLRSLGYRSKVISDLATVSTEKRVIKNPEFKNASTDFAQEKARQFNFIQFIFNFEVIYFFNIQLNTYC